MFVSTDATRFDITRIMPDEKAVTAVTFRTAAVAYYRSLEVSVVCVMTDNGDFARAEGRH